MTTDASRYGRTRVAKIRAAYNDLRTAVQAGDIERAQEALDRYEPWADYVLGGGITQAAAALSEIASISGGPIRTIAQDALDKMDMSGCGDLVRGPR